MLLSLTRVLLILTRGTGDTNGGAVFLDMYNKNLNLSVISVRPPPSYIKLLEGLLDFFKLPEGLGPLHASPGSLG